MEPSKRQRFYDREPMVANSIDLMALFPPELQATISESLNMAAMREHGVGQRMTRLKSLGVENILPLFKSKKKRRHYDQNPHFHQAINCLRVMTQEERNMAAIKVVTLAGYADYYLGLCDVTSIPNACKQVTEIRNRYIDLGPVAAKQHLLNLCADFLGRFNVDSVRLGKDGSSIFSN